MFVESHWDFEIVCYSAKLIQEIIGEIVNLQLPTELLYPVFTIELNAWNNVSSPCHFKITFYTSRMKKVICCYQMWVWIQQVSSSHLGLLLCGVETIHQDQSAAFHVCLCGIEMPFWELTVQCYSGDWGRLLVQWQKWHCKEGVSKYSGEEFPSWHSGNMRFQVWSLAFSISGLRIRCCHELWCRLQTWLRSHVAVAVM